MKLSASGKLPDKDDVSLRGGAVDVARPGWSSTRGVAILDHGDHAFELGPHGAPLDVNS
jgi:hypothetical protein